MMSLRFVPLLWLALSPVLLCQEIPDPPPPVEGGRSVERLMTIIPALEIAEADLAAMRERLAAAGTEEEKKEIAAEVDLQRERVRQLRENFQTLATGVEEGRYTSQAEEPVSWQQNLEDILAPISEGVRELTAEPRQTEEMKKELARWRDRKSLSDAALSRIEELMETAESRPVRDELEQARKLWGNRQAEAASQIEVFEQQIEERAGKTPTGWKAISTGVARFWRSRGLNLMLAIGLALLVFFGVRRGYRLLQRFSPLHKKANRGIAARSADLLSLALGVVLALVTAMLVFYLRGDWLLLTLTIVAVIGILWASKEALPPYIDQIRLILNLGSVRQGERIIYDGIPWRVDKLNFYCDFRNPELLGGHLRLPVRDVIPLHSREADPKEPYFPTRADDWVILGDETYGKVVQQTPDQVVVLRLGGSRTTYSAADFLGNTPHNLSRGFRISSLFGIDYRHQGISTSEVPEILAKRIEEELLAAVDRENLRSVKVEFSSAGASSLDYEVLADFSGEVASRMNVLRRLIQRTCVDVCNERGWGIPFTQITVHQA